MHCASTLHVTSMWAEAGGAGEPRPAAPSGHSPLERPAPAQPGEPGEVAVGAHQLRAQRGRQRRQVRVRDQVAHRVAGAALRDERPHAGPRQIGRHRRGGAEHGLQVGDGPVERRRRDEDAPVGDALAGTR